MEIITEKKEITIKELIKILWSLNLNQPVIIECVTDENKLLLINARILIDDSTIIGI